MFAIGLPRFWIRNLSVIVVPGVKIFHLSFVTLSSLNATHHQIQHVILINLTGWEGGANHFSYIISHLSFGYLSLCGRVIPWNNPLEL
jgi:hypothetical protein